MSQIISLKILAISVLVMPGMVYTTPQGSYLWISGGCGMLYDKDQDRISGKYSGFLAKDWISFLGGHYQHSKTLGISWVLREQFSEYRIAGISDYHTDMRHFSCQYTLCTLKDMISCYVHSGGWHAIAHAVINDQNFFPMTGYGVSLGLGINVQCLSRGLITVAYYRLWSLSQEMCGTQLIKINLGLRFTK